MPAGHQYRSDIDGLRAFAVLSVVLFHAFPEWISGGFIGVDVFFVISGFLISIIIFEKLEQGNFSFADFYARRVRRIFPALILVLVTSFVLGWCILFVSEYKQLGKHIAGVRDLSPISFYGARAAILTIWPTLSLCCIYGVLELKSSFTLCGHRFCGLYGVIDCVAYLSFWLLGLPRLQRTSISLRLIR